MASTKHPYVRQQPVGPALRFDLRRAGPALSAARRMQGFIEGKAQAIGIERDGRIARAILGEPASDLPRPAG